MLKISMIAATLLATALAMAPMAHAACTSEDAMNLSSEASEVLMNKVQTNPDKAAGMMQEMGTITGGPTTEATCTKLKDLKVRAEKL